jgi:hypothetical protein
MRRESSDVILVGAGPIGLEMAVALKRAGVDYVHLEAKQIGYTISWYAPQTRFFSSNERIAIAGVPLQTADNSKSTREQYLAYLRSVVEQFDLQVNTYEPVTNVRRLGDGTGRDGFEVTTPAGATGARRSSWRPAAPTDRASSTSPAKTSRTSATTSPTRTCTSASGCSSSAARTRPSRRPCAATTPARASRSATAGATAGEVDQVLAAARDQLADRRRADRGVL